VALRRIVYNSVATQHFSKRSLLDLLHQSRGYNHLDDITGLLMFDDGHFLQVVEGPDEAVGQLLVRLRNDTRHGQFQIHQDSLTDDRLFPDWRMGFGELSDPALSFLPGFITNGEQEERVRLLVDRIPSVAQQLRAALAE